MEDLPEDIVIKVEDNLDHRSRKFLNSSFCQLEESEWLKPTALCAPLRIRRKKVDACPSARVLVISLKRPPTLRNYNEVHIIWIVQQPRSIIFQIDPRIKIYFNTKKKKSKSVAGFAETPREAFFQKPPSYLSSLSPLPLSLLPLTLSLPLSSRRRIACSPLPCPAAAPLTALRAQPLSPDPDPDPARGRGSERK